ncbi:aminotransferase class V-fold PLP-dependent enzyme [Ramlibacter sp. WS9]|uniref:aminotransferase class V-fold PLP-dependent enzyme n=1 Tax=Ramlibacter sp. WS9 TaxID=1882741 RepID=UPI0011436468|nr:aminotransferase class V-fold PLP-dependent enzyme [Ramlibacter sp. WS9]ROZ78335.1 aminotransferase class V-fold PLP-dependent enzyme [Ramlibacter sp. WS9]
MPTPSSPLRCQRDLFSLPDGHCYLNSAFMGPLPRLVEQAGVAALTARASPIDLTPKDFFEPAERTRGLFARLVNADPERVAFVPTAAYAIAIVARNLRPRSGQNVVMLGDMFPSNVYAWRNWRAENVEMRTVLAPAAPWSSESIGTSRAALWNAAVVAAIDADTLLVAVEPAHWTDGTLFDLDRIGRRCREVGAALVIDATQTVGAMPFDVRRVQPDALVVHSYKSMLANYGLGFAVFSDRFLEGSPLEESWLMRSGSENFARLVDYEDHYAQGMRRFDTSLRANPVLIAMLEAACRLLIDWQPGRVRDYLLQIERQSVERMRSLGFEVADEAERCANLFGVKLPAGMDPEACRRHLARQQIHVAVRGNAVRVSPHVYNDEYDLEQLADALAQLAPTQVKRQ